MIFGDKLLPKVLSGEKTVTRRPVKYMTITNGFADGTSQSTTSANPCKYTVGRPYGVQPVIKEGPGKGRGGKAVARIRIKDVRREPLGEAEALSEQELQLEGFASTLDMVAYWWSLYTNWKSDQLVDRIEFELVSGGRGDE